LAGPLGCSANLSRTGGALGKESRLSLLGCAGLRCGYGIETMTALARVRLAIVVVALGVAAYVEWPAVGAAFSHMQAVVTTASDLANGACAAPNEYDEFVPGLLEARRLGRCNPLPVADAGGYVIQEWSDPNAANHFLQEHRSALDGLAAAATAHRRDAVLGSVLRDLGKPMRSLLLVLTIAVAAFVLAPLAVRR
jgi:hypothetical protein